MTELHSTQQLDGGPAPAPLDRVLERGVEAGVVTPEQARRLLTLAAEPPSSRVPRPSGPRHGPLHPVAVEVLGYVGGVLALGAGVFVAQEYWADLSPWARAGVLAVLAVAAGAAGGLLLRARGAAGRLAGFLWLVSVPAVGGAVGILVADLTDAAGSTVALASIGAGAAVAWGEWALRRSVVQHVAAFATLVALSVSTLVALDESLLDLAGYLVWALGAAWLLLADRGLVRPVGTGWVLGALAAVGGPAVFGRVDGPGALLATAFALASAAAVVALGVRTRRHALVVIGVLGLLRALPVLLVELFEGRIAVPVVVLVTGVILVAASVLLARRAVDDARDHQGDDRP